MSILFALEFLALLQLTSRSHLQPSKLRALDFTRPRQKTNRCEYTYG